MTTRFLTPEQMRARTRRNLALGGALAAFVVLVFVSTMLNMKRNAERYAAQQSLAVAAAPAAPAAAQ